MESIQRKRKRKRKMTIKDTKHQTPDTDRHGKKKVNPRRGWTGNQASTLSRYEVRPYSVRHITLHRLLVRRRCPNRMGKSEEEEKARAGTTRGKRKKGGPCHVESKSLWSPPEILVGGRSQIGGTGDPLSLFFSRFLCLSQPFRLWRTT